MTIEEMRIAVAESCPQLFFVTTSFEVCWKDSGTVVRKREWLEAMRELETALPWEPESEYCPAQEYYEQLIFVCGRSLPKGKPFGYVCHICGEQIYDSQQTEHSESGLVHAQCPEADCYDWHLVTATFAQRAEAYLRWKGLWKE